MQYLISINAYWALRRHKLVVISLPTKLVPEVVWSNKFRQLAWVEGCT